MAFLKKYWFFILLALAATLLVFLNFYLTNGPKKETAPEAPSWRGVVPGETSTDSLLKNLGAPQSQKQAGDQTLLEYPRPGLARPNEVIVENNTVELVKEKVSGKKLSGFKAQYGEPEGEYWGPEKEAGFKVFVYPQTGLAVVASLGDGAVLEVWYFKPTTLNQFLATWGKDLNTEFVEEPRF